MTDDTITSAHPAARKAKKKINGIANKGFEPGDPVAAKYSANANENTQRASNDVPAPHNAARMRLASGLD